MAHLIMVRNSRRTDKQTSNELTKHQTQAYKEIFLHSCSIGAKSLPLIVSVLKRSSATLTQLKLLYGEISDEHLAVICAAVAECSSLLHLSIEGPQTVFGDIGTTSLARVLYNNVELLDLYLTIRTSASLAKLLPTLPSLAKLQTLHLEWIELSDIEPISALFRWAKYNTTLTKLWTSDGAPLEIVADCFTINQTITSTHPATRYGIINKFCNEFGTTQDVRQNVPAHIQGAVDIRNFLKDLQEKPVLEWNALKLVILGHSQVGKSTLLHALQNYNIPLRSQKSRPAKGAAKTVMDAEYTPTIGIDISTMKLGKAEATVWDLGGHLEYSVTHQFVLSSEMVIYLLCYDISADRLEQISYWLNFLNSTICFSKQNRKQSKVILVGTKSDLLKKIDTSDNPVPSVKKQWPDLPLHKQHFIVSSKAAKGIEEFREALKKICSDILIKHSTQPKIYKTLYDTIQTIPKDQCVMSLEALQCKYARYLQPQEFSSALRYLHAVGLLVVLPGGLVFTVPSMLPQISAKFVAPLVVRDKLLSGDPVTILAPHQIEIVGTQEAQKRAQQEIELMERVGICFKLASDHTAHPSYIFPSLASRSDKFHFSINVRSVSFAGMRVIAPPGKIFTAGFFCQLVVRLLSGFNITQRDLIAVHSNGVVFTCNDVFVGQLIVKTEENPSVLVFLMAASDPNLAPAIFLFDELVKIQLPEYGIMDKQVLCPTCIEKFNTDTSKIATVVEGATEQQVCNCGKRLQSVPPPKQDDTKISTSSPHISPPLSNISPPLSNKSPVVGCKNLDLPDGLVIKDGIQFDGDEYIASGAYGEVWKALWRGAFVAVKKLSMNIATSHVMKTLESEINIAAKLRHPYVVQLCGVCIFSNTELWIVMEFADGGSLYSQLSDDNPKDIPWPTRWKWAEQAAIAVHALHSAHIIHRDIKSPNFLLVKGDLKITDFGMSTAKTLSTTSSSYNDDTACGTVRWLAPECTSAKPKFNEKSDLFSLGMVLWENASRQVPFADQPHNSIVITLVRNGERPEIPDDCPKEYTEIVQQCWEHSTEARPSSAGEVASMLSRAANIKEEKSSTT